MSTIYGGPELRPSMDNEVRYRNPPGGLTADGVVIELQPPGASAPRPPHPQQLTIEGADLLVVVPDMQGTGVRFLLVGPVTSDGNGLHAEYSPNPGSAALTVRVTVAQGETLPHSIRRASTLPQITQSDPLDW